MRSGSLSTWRFVTIGKQRTGRRTVGDDVEIGGFRLVGPGLANWLAALSKRYRRSRARLQEFLHDWLGVWINTGAIHEALAEAAAIAAPLEQERVQAIPHSGPRHADATPWPEQGASSRRRWVFVTRHAVLYDVRHRGQERVKHRLEDLPAS